MKDIWLLLIHLVTTAAKLLGPGGVKGIIAENLPTQAATARRLPSPAAGAESVSGQPILAGVLLAFSPDQPHHENGYVHPTIDAVEIS